MEKCALCGNENNNNAKIKLGRMEYGLCGTCTVEWNRFCNGQAKVGEIITADTTPVFENQLLYMEEKAKSDRLEQIQLKQLAELDYIHSRMGWLTFFGVLKIIELVLILLFYFSLSSFGGRLY